MSNNDLTIRRHEAQAGREIKASAHYQYVVNGITLDGSKFAAGELVLEGQVLAKNNTSGLYEKAPADLTGFSNPVILDESIKFELTDAGANPNVTAGQVIVHGSVYEGMLIGLNAAVKAELKGYIRFV